MKALELKMLSELVKNSRRSDRELAKSIGTSQPTATRIRNKLEKEGYLNEYTAVPNFSKIGYSILALTFMKLDPRLTLEEFEEFRKRHQGAIAKRSFAILLAKRGMGLKFDAVILSLHQNYASYDDFRHYLQRSMSEYMDDLDTFLSNLEEKSNLPFTFSLLASQMMSLADTEEDKTK